MKDEFPYQIINSLLCEYLSKNLNGDFSSAVNGVIELAKRHNLYKGSTPPMNRIGPSYELNIQDYYKVPEIIRQLFWRFLIQGILVFGRNQDNPNWPFYRVTEYGEKVLTNQGPQPYDPDAFLTEFRKKNPSVDPIIFDYVTESVLSFNLDCLKSSAVMLGCASEQAILLFHEAFELAIKDPNTKKCFKRSYRWNIYSKFNALRNGLENMISTNKLPQGFHETVRNHLVGIFDLIRRYRNSAGHPNLLKTIHQETIFLNLRIFSEYIFQIYNLIDYFQKNPAEP